MYVSSVTHLNLNSKIFAHTILTTQNENLAQYAVYTRDYDLCVRVFEFITHYQLLCEPHLNRTRFWIPRYSYVHTVFLLQFGGLCTSVTDLVYTIEDDADPVVRIS